MLCLALVGAAYVFGRLDGSASVQSQWSAERLRIASEVQQWHEKTRLAEREAADRIVRIQEQTSESLIDSDRRHRADLERLRLATASQGRGELPRSAAARLAACPEPEVAGGDERVVARPKDDELRWPIDYARDVAVMQSALDSCVAQYQNVQKLMEVAQ